MNEHVCSIKEPFLEHNNWTLESMHKAYVLPTKA